MNISFNSLAKDAFQNPLTTAGLITGTQYVLTVAASSFNPFTTSLQLTFLVSAVADTVSRVTNDIFEKTFDGWASKDVLKTLTNFGTSFGGAFLAQWLNNNFLVSYFPGAGLGILDNNGRLVLTVAVFLTRLSGTVLKELFSSSAQSAPKKPGATQSA